MAQLNWGVALLWLGGGFLALLLLGEGILRWGFGLGHPLLYVADAQMGYRLRPRQRLRRLGRRIEINEYSMRGGTIAPTCPPGQWRILLLGDSVAQGGWWTDQTQIISVQLNRLLSPNYGPGEVLNASANSWGPRNELAYLEQFGCFGAQIVLLLLNTDDLFATAPTMLQVGRDRNYPDRAPWCAWAELYSYSVKKPQPIPGLKAVQKEEGDRVGKNLGAIAQMQHICQDQQAQLLIALSPLKREVNPGLPRNYEQVARERLDLWAHEHHIPYLDLLGRFNSTGNTPDLPAKYQRDRLYRDHIHLSPLGNQLVSQALAQWLQRLFPEKLNAHFPPSGW